MSSKLKAITTKAKQLYKTGKFAKWTDAIKEASKNLSKGKKVSGVKKAVKKKAVKKATKKKAVKKSAPKSYHKDTKSHNVKISVVSGSPRLHFISKENEIIEKIKSLIKYNNEIEHYINDAKYKIKNNKSEFFVKHQKKQVQDFVKRYTKLLKSNKKYLNELKKGIK